MSNHTSNKKIKCILIYLLACFVLLAACQQSPEKEVIANKGNSKLEELVLEKASTGDGWTQKGNRIVWNETKKVNTEIGECSVSVSMDIDMPEYPGPVPVFLIEPREFGMDFLKKTAGYLLGDEIFDGKPSKQDVTIEILDTKKQISEHVILDGYQEVVDEGYSFLDEEYNDASETNKEPKYEFITNQYGQNSLWLKSYFDNNIIMDFTASADKAGKCYSFIFRGNKINTSFCYLEGVSNESIQANGAEIKYDQALMEADTAMKALFEEPYAMVYAYTIDKINDLEYLWNDGGETSLGQAYVFCYFREYCGFPSLYIDPVSTFTTENTEYAKPYRREYAQVVVDDRGIVEMIYESFSGAIKRLNGDVKLMPFEKVLDRFKNDIFYQSLWGYSAEITVKRIEFGMVREPVKDDPNNYMMVPAWNFIGDVKTNWAEQREKSILALNALDGSVITDYESICDPK